MKLRACIIALIAVAIALPAHAADKVRVAKAVGSQFVYAPLDVGIAQGIFAKYGIAVEISTMTGEARLQQGLTAGSLDVGLAGNSGAALSVKGAPTIAVAAYANAPRNFSVVVLADSPIKTVADLKGKLLSGATTGGLPEWLVKRLGVVEGWGADGVRSISVGSPDASLSALRTRQVDGMMTATATGILLEDQGIGRIVTQMGDFAANFHTSLVFVRKDFVAQSPDTLRGFLKGLFASVAFVKANKDKTVAIAAPVLHLSPAIVSRVYDIESPILSDDGHFDAAAVDALKQSLVDMGALTEKPRDEQIIDTRFVPVKF
ncbi:MAG TPA: ABC transporter substrate-binding protein [Stellaceae bacterium]|nr:ABC transporter substrate-binding protein [Stellaceae bacterium]